MARTSWSELKIVPPWTDELRFFSILQFFAQLTLLFFCFVLFCCRQRDDRDVLWFPSVPPVEKPPALEAAGLRWPLVTSPTSCWLVGRLSHVWAYWCTVTGRLAEGPLRGPWTSSVAEQEQQRSWVCFSPLERRGPVDSASDVLFPPLSIFHSAYLSEKREREGREKGGEARDSSSYPKCVSRH